MLHVRSLLNEQLEHLCVSFRCGPHERCLVFAILRVNLRVFFEQSFHRARFARA